jgi:hypothetical protein
MKPELEVQKFLRLHGDMPEHNLSILQTDFGIYTKKHPKFPELVQFNYDMIESFKNKNHPIVKECRGLILNSEDNWNVVAYPFNRFANYGEDWADEIDWNSAQVQEKIDGSLIIVYYYGYKWNAATRNSPNASGNVGNFDITFCELFWQYFYAEYNMQQLNTLLTYMFELVDPKNRVVVDYKQGNIYLVGIRGNLSNQEIPVSSVEFNCPFNTVNSFPLKSFDEIIEASKILNPLEHEGYVVVDKFFHRVKIKSPKYVLIHHMKDGFGIRRIIDLIKLGETNEVLSYFPEYLKLFKKVEDKINQFSEDYEHIYSKYKDIESQKEFALQVIKYGQSSVLFSLRKGIIKTAREGFLNIPTNRLEEILCINIDID